MTKGIVLRKLGPEDGDWVKDLFHDRWGSLLIVTRGQVHKVDQMETLDLESKTGVGDQGYFWPFG